MNDIDNSDRTDAMDRPFDRLFEDLRRTMLGDGGRRGGFRTERTDDAVVVTADVPGFATEDIELFLEGEELVLNAVTEHDETTADGARRTRRSVHERIGLPDGVDADAIEATYRNGVLQVTLPVADDDRGRRIDVN